MNELNKALAIFHDITDKLKNAISTMRNDINKLRDKIEKRKVKIESLNDKERFDLFAIEEINKSITKAEGILVKLEEFAA